MRTTKLLILLFFISFGFAGFSQQYSKVNFPFVNALHNNAEKEFTVLVKGNASAIETKAKNYNVQYLYSVKNVSVVRGKAKDLQALANESFVQRLELSNNHYRVLDDSSLSKSNVNPVHSGMAPLDTAGYRGKDVIIGVIDTGIDFEHPDFKDSSGKTRVLWIWDQAHAGASGTPTPYGYGQEWNNLQIDSGLCTLVDSQDGAHGTKVSGVAAGNGNSAFQYRGIAPEADIIVVAVDFNNTSDPTMVDAANYIFAKADSLGKPCVVNISLGDYYGSHDGTDLQTQLMENMITSQNSRAIVAAAGNGGNVPFHLGYDVTSDTSFTWFTNGDPQLYLDVYADSATFQNVNFAIGVASPDFTYKGNIAFTNMNTAPGMVLMDSIYADTNRIGLVYSYTDITNGLVTQSFMVVPDSLNYLWSFAATGSGHFDAWNFDFVASGMPADTVFPAIIYYKRPDTLQTVCTSFQCSDKIISVGNYVCRSGYVDVNDSLQTFPGTVDSIFYTSSHGPTRDGRIKPDISASGENIVTTGAAWFTSWLINNYPYIVTQDSFHMIFDGTSAASPVVAGLAALYFQQNPSASYTDLKHDIIACAKHDMYTGPDSNNTYGYGKLDGYGALTCSYVPVGIKNEQRSNNLLIYPNPNNGSMTVVMDGFSDGANIQLLNVLGQVVYTSKLKDGKSIINVPGLTEGIYFVKVSDGKLTVTQKVIVE